MTLGQETRWAYSTMLASPHGAINITEEIFEISSCIVVKLSYFVIEHVLATVSTCLHMHIKRSYLHTVHCMNNTVSEMIESTDSNLIRCH